MVLPNPLHPRPLLQRDPWFSLDGPWDFAFDAGGRWTEPEQIEWTHTIQVPFSPETEASGIGDTGFYRAVWYRRTFTPPRGRSERRLILHFGAVDTNSNVWVNGHLVMRHEGGYTPFQADITDYLDRNGPQTIIVQAEDDPLCLAKPRGKQDWQLEPHSIWYPRTTGIWQTVWLESVPESWIGSIRWLPCLERWEIGFEAWLQGKSENDLRLELRMEAGNTLLAKDTYQVVAGEVHRRIALSDPGIDDYRNELLWSPATPTLIDVTLRLLGPGDKVIDEAYSYTALRSIGVQGDRFLLNDRPYTLRMVLDQGYWPETGLTAPDVEALRRDVELAKAMGFNGVRKHQKIEDPRYLYWADKLGLLVWEEMPSAYRYTRESIERLTQSWTEVIRRDSSHPCIIAWVPFNESWGVPNLPDSPGQRHYVQALYHLTKSLDASRPVVGNDGWESVATDIIGIHDYDDQPERIARRYGTEQDLSRLFQRERPAGRLLLLSEEHTNQPIMLSEFGGIAYSGDPDKTWGYTRVEDAESFAAQYGKLLAAVRRLSVLAGFCYTQFADTYQETNGLLYADRTPKFPLEEMALATRGPRSNRDQQIERDWRERMMKLQRAPALMAPDDPRNSEARRPAGQAI
ncbi:MAG: glycoside hydrolase family 2 protein [Gemmataceae bacterium]